MINEWSPDLWIGPPSEDCRAEDPALAAWIDVKNELFQTSPVPDEVWHGVPGLIFSWVQTKNPHYIDYAVLLFHKHNIPPTKTVMREVARAAGARTTGSPCGTSNEVRKKGANSTVFVWMMHLVAAGESVESAAEKAAYLYSVEFPGLRAKKASSLEKEYPKFANRVIVKRTMYQDIKLMHERDIELAAYWKLIT